MQVLASMIKVPALFYLTLVVTLPSLYVFSALMFAVASVSAQWLLRREYRPLIARHPTHRWMLRTWMLIYVFVGIQMGWVLRPFIGNPTARVQFFREDSWSNAYVVVAEMIWRVLIRTQ